MPSAPSRALTTDDKTWPKLASAPAKKYTLPAASCSSQNQHSRGVNANYDAALDSFQKVGPGGVATHVQPDCTSDKGTQSPRTDLSRSLTGLDDQRLSTGAASRSPSVRSTTPPTSIGRTKPPPALLPPPVLRIETSASRLSYRDAARKQTPPASPTAASRPTSPTKSNVWLPAPSAQHLPQVVEAFPPLSPAGGNRGVAPALASRSYATAAHSKVPATSAPAAVVSESPTTATTHKVISLNIGSARPVTPTNGPGPPRLSPLNESPIRSRGRKKANTTNGQSPSRLSLPERSRSASVSSVATSIITTASSSRVSSKATSIAPSPGPNTANKKNRLSSASLPSPNWETEEWFDKLVKFVQAMRRKDRAAWEKILRCDPKDTSKMKWAEFDTALKALGFRVNARGGSDLEYTPTLFGDNAQPISYHRPHPGQEFSLGDLKAKSNSFRARYPGPVAALHQAWGLTDTRL